MPEWHGKIYATRSDLQAIVRAQENEVIKCADTRFDGHLCMSNDDFMELYGILLQCKDWGRAVGADVSMIPDSSSKAMKMIKEHHGLIVE